MWMDNIPNNEEFTLRYLEPPVARHVWSCDRHTWTSTPASVSHRPCNVPHPANPGGSPQQTANTDYPQTPGADPPPGRRRCRRCCCCCGVESWPPPPAVDGDWTWTESCPARPGTKWRWRSFCRFGWNAQSVWGESWQRWGESPESVAWWTPGTLGSWSTWSWRRSPDARHAWTSPDSPAGIRARPRPEICPRRGRWSWRRRCRIGRPRRSVNLQWRSDRWCSRSDCCLLSLAQVHPYRYDNVGAERPRWRWRTRGHPVVRILPGDARESRWGEANGGESAVS